MELNLTYSNWLYSRHILNILQKKYTESDYYEAKNIIERYLISLLNGIANSKDKMLNEFSGKNLIFEPEILERPKIQTLTNIEKFSTENDKLTIGEFKVIFTERMRYLCNKYGLYITGITYLKYDSILPGAQHWGIPWEVSNLLYKYNFLNEGFASPINSRLIDLPNGKYCSIFPDTDPDSLGSFFDVDLIEYDGNWSINPPMIETIIESSVDKILTNLTLHAGKAYFISLANWIDMDSYKRLQYNKNLKKMQILYRGTYYYQNPDKDIIKANFNSVYFVLTDENHPGFPDEFYEELYKAWSLPSGYKSTYTQHPPNKNEGRLYSSNSNDKTFLSKGRYPPNISRNIAYSLKQDNISNSSNPDDKLSTTENKIHLFKRENTSYLSKYNRLSSPKDNNELTPQPHENKQKIYSQRYNKSIPQTYENKQQIYPPKYNKSIPQTYENRQQIYSPKYNKSFPQKYENKQQIFSPKYNKSFSQKSGNTIGNTQHTQQTYNSNLINENIYESLDNLSLENMSNEITPLVIEKYINNDRRFYVINDAEKYQAGSKERSLDELINLAKEHGTLIYVGTKGGYAQIAIAKAAYLARKKAILYLQSYDKYETTMTMRAREFNPKIIYVSDQLYNITVEAEKYVSKNGGFLVDFGLNEIKICNLIEDKLREEIKITEFPSKVKRIWLVAGSCVILNVLYKVFPDAEFNVVQVGKNIEGKYNPKNTIAYKSSYKFPESTRILPPYKSISTYDAKVWEFVLKYGKDGDYILNVGKE